MSALLFCCFLMTTVASPDDGFDRLDGADLAAAIEEAASPAREKLTIDEIVAQPRLLPQSRASLLVARTDQGNIARLLISPGLRKPSGGEGEALPVLFIERFDTFELPGGRNRIATGRELVLFDGFRLDLDAGLVVPDGQGGDVQFHAAEGRGTLDTLANAQLFILTSLPTGRAVARPARGRVVVPADFGGRYRFNANGQWLGTLELEVSKSGSVGGWYRSEQSGTAYRVVGEAGKPEAGAATLTIRFPRSEMTLQAWLWTEGKRVMAGTAQFMQHGYSFIAVRDDGGDAPPEAQAAAERPADFEVQVLADGSWRVEGRAVDAAEVRGQIETLLNSRAAAGLRARIVVSGEARFERVNELKDMLRDMGPVDVELTLQPPAR